jgi:hypothetical protein
MCTFTRYEWLFRVDADEMTEGLAAFDAHRWEDFPLDEVR